MNSLKLLLPTEQLPAHQKHFSVRALVEMERLYIAWYINYDFYYWCCQQRPLPDVVVLLQRAPALVCARHCCEVVGAACGVLALSVLAVAGLQTLQAVYPLFRASCSEILYELYLRYWQLERWNFSPVRVMYTESLTVWASPCCTIKSSAKRKINWKTFLLDNAVMISEVTEYESKLKIGFPNDHGSFPKPHLRFPKPYGAEIR